ncbi:hypothetical protein [Vibrio kanaloae]|uniref:hypothetical protein n=1 Tax=Vibrio kanaloae TaxID=170673 RepID=UPI0010BF0422|nr:hypothetical protein [Vibrio kanaloae]TKF12469.1 hypothetical protein FCV47_20830 [Vibrio kanaloae]
MRYVSFLFVGFLSFQVHSDNFSLKLSTQINTSELYRDSIEKAYFEPSDLILESTEDKVRFKDVLTHFNIKTKIPREAASVGYVVSLDKNIAYCEDSSGGSPVEQPKFVSISFEGKSMLVGESLVFSDFNADDGTHKTSQHPVIFSFKPFDEIVTESQAESCEGAIDIIVGVDI